MKKLLAILFIFCGALYGQTTTHVQGATVFTVIARGIPWTGTGSVNSDQRWWWDTPSSGGNACLMITNNNATNARGFNFGFGMNVDINTLAPDNTAVNNGWVRTTSTITISVPALGTIQQPIITAGAAHGLLIINTVTGTAGGANDNATIAISNNNNCVNSASVGQFQPLVVSPPTQWTIFSAPVAGTIASVSKAAATGIHHTAQAYTIALSTNAATACGPVDIVIRDGATGVGTVIWDTKISVPAVAAQWSGLTHSGLQLVGTAGNAMTIEFGSTGATCIESVDLSGFDQ